MEVKYSKKIDRAMFREVNVMGHQLTPIFGFKFQRVTFDKRVIPIAKVTADVVGSFIDENKLNKLIEGIYNKNLPKLTVYINTTPFSSWDTKNKRLLLSYTRNDSARFFSTICHESNHLMYDLIFGTKKYQDTKIKETLSVLNNLFDVEDKGWEIFSKQRSLALKFYRKHKDIFKTVEYTRELFR